MPRVGLMLSARVSASGLTSRPLELKLGSLSFKLRYCHCTFFRNGLAERLYALELVHGLRREI